MVLLRIKKPGLGVVPQRETEEARSHPPMASRLLGRGSSIDSFPLFGYDLAYYEDLFEEKVDLFAELMKGGPITWEGKTRPPLRNQDVVPHIESGPFPVWIGVGGSPQSVIRAARHGFSLMLAIIGGSPARFAPFAELFRQALESVGRALLPVGVHGPVMLPPPTSAPVKSSGRAIGRSSPTSARRADSPSRQRRSARCRRTRNRRPEGRAKPHRSRRLPLRFEYGMGGLSHEALMANIELYGTQVMPRVRELLA